MSTDTTLEKPETTAPPANEAPPAGQETEIEETGDAGGDERTTETTGKQAGFLDDDGDDAGEDDDSGEIYKQKEGEGAQIPDNWREIAAGGDDKLLATLKRYGSLNGVVKALTSAQQKIRSGEYKRGLPDDASEEEVAEWRKENGVPDAPDGYKVPDIKDHEWTEADQPMIGLFTQAMHKANANQGQIDAALSTYAQLVAQAKEMQAQTDTDNEAAVVDHLRTQFGAEFRPMNQLMTRLLRDQEVMPNGLGDMLRNARTAEGTRLIHDPSFAMWIAEFARDTYGAGAMVSGEGQATVNSRIEELRNMRNSDIDKYNNERNAKGQTFADEYMELMRKTQSSPRMQRA